MVQPNRNNFCIIVTGLVASLRRLICCGGRHQESEENEARLHVLKQELHMDEHKISINDLLKRYLVDHQWVLSNGLTSNQVAQRQKLYGENCLTPPKKIPEWKKFCKQLFGGFSLLLWFGALLCFVA